MFEKWTGHILIKHFLQFHCALLELHCAPVFPPANGAFAKGPCDTVFGTRCYFTCNEGYELNNRVLRCDSLPSTELAFWEGDKPECEGKSDLTVFFMPKLF